MADFIRIDKESWQRKDTFNYFSQFELPFFNITANVDVGGLKSFCEKTNYSFFLASVFAAMKAANDIAEFKMRIRGKEIIQHEKVRIGSTIQYEDHSFGFCYFPYLASMAAFNTEGKTLLKEALAEKSFLPKDGSDDVLHMSVIPWLHFKGFQHARRIGQQDSIPKIVFGKYQEEGGAHVMPVNVEIHHALADGYHVGLFFEKFQAYLNNPG
jgi:chloramphenicol O-acetyltransferase type A